MQLGRVWWRRLLALFAALTLGLSACGDRSLPPSPPATPGAALDLGRLEEAPVPAAIATLRRRLDAYRPQVAILSPRPDATLESDRVEVRFQVRDLPVFKDAALGLGPHLHLILDDAAYQPVYDLEAPVVLEGLAPGTHTLRVFASRPWHESFKNEGAYAQVTFHVVTPSPGNRPDPSRPLVTYSRPSGRYGAEPILLDFYLTNAPLHELAQADPEDDLHDWRVRVTVNGESFTLEDWQPIWLKGFQPGRNWVKTELLDESGEAIATPFNTTVRFFDYEPGGDATLDRLVRGDLTAIQAGGIVDPDYVVPAEPEPLPIEEPVPLPSAPTEPPAIAPVEEPQADEPESPEPVAPIADPPPSSAASAPLAPEQPRPSVGVEETPSEIPDLPARRPEPTLPPDAPLPSEQADPPSRQAPAPAAAQLTPQERLGTMARLFGDRARTQLQQLQQQAQDLGREAGTQLQSLQTRLRPEGSESTGTGAEPQPKEPASATVETPAAAVEAVREPVESLAVPAPAPATPSMALPDDPDAIEFD